MVTSPYDWEILLDNIDANKTAMFHTLHNMYVYKNHRVYTWKLYQNMWLCIKNKPALSSNRKWEEVLEVCLISTAVFVIV